MRKRWIAALAAGAALVVAGCGSDTPATNTANAQQQQQAGGPPQGAGGPDSSALAKQLGVSTSKLDAAMRKLRAGGQGRADDMAASLAKELGLTTAKVKAALEATRPQGTPPGNGQGGQAPPSGTPAAGTNS